MHLHHLGKVTDKSQRVDFAFASGVAVAGSQEPDLSYKCQGHGRTQHRGHEMFEKNPRWRRFHFWSNEYVPICAYLLCVCHMFICEMISKLHSHGVTERMCLAQSRRMCANCRGCAIPVQSSSRPWSKWCRGKASLQQVCNLIHLLIH